MIADGIHTDLSDADYFADPCEQPSLSQSIATTIVNKSALHAYLEHPRLGGKPRIPSKAMNVGTICHALLLNQPLNVELIAFGDFKKKEAQEKRDAAIAIGKIPVPCDKWVELKGAAESIRDKILAKGIRFDGVSEVALIWKKDGVQCRGKMDHLSGMDGLDLKFGDSAHPKVIDRHSADFGYDIQAAAYTEAIGECCLDFRGRSTFTFIFCEIEEPYCVTLATMSGAKRRIGEAKWDYARGVWRKCLETNVWPEYVADGYQHTIEAKPWELVEAERYGIDSTEV